MAAFTAGQVLTANTLNIKTRKALARARRITNSSSSTSTTLVGVLRLDDIPLKANTSYRITWRGSFDVATATDTMRGLITHTTDGTTPTTSSGTLKGSGGEVPFTSASSATTVTVVTDYTPGADLTLSLLLCIQHVIGTSAGILVAADTHFNTDMYVDDMGDDPGDTGTDI